MWGKQRPWQTLSREKTGTLNPPDRARKRGRSQGRERGKQRQEEVVECRWKASQREQEGGERSRHREERRKTKAGHRREMKGEWREEAGVEQERDACCQRREKQSRGGGSGERPREAALGGGQARK